MSPVYNTGDPGSGPIALVYAPLLESDPQTAELRPGLAERFDATADAKRITFMLRDGLVWSDGAPLTADDYLYTVAAIARSKVSLMRSRLQYIVGWRDYVEGRADTIAGIRTFAGGRGIEVTLERTSCLSVRHLAVSPIPKHDFVSAWNDRSIDASQTFDGLTVDPAKTSASGPFTIEQLQRGVQLTLARNVRYFRGAPLLDGVVFQVITGTGPLRNAFVAGESLMLKAASADVEYVRQRSGGSAREYRVTQPGYGFLSWNQEASGAPWLADKRVRQALWYGLDVATIVDRVEFGFAQQVYANTPPAFWAYDGSGLNHYAYDPVRARQLLEAAGATMAADGVYRWRGGQRMRMKIETNTGNPTRSSIVQIAQQQYKTIGIDVEPLIEAFALVQNRLVTPDGSVEGVLIGWNFDFPDPDPYDLFHSSQRGKNGLNWVNINSADLDKAIDAERYGPDCGLGARRAAFRAVDRILNDEAPYTFLYATDSVWFVSDSLRRSAPAAFGEWLGIEKWWIKR